MRFHRPERISSLIKEKLGWILMKEVEIPGTLITITGVNVDKKIDQALIKVSVLPSHKSEEALRILKKRTGGLQFLLNRELNMRAVPKIYFEIDGGAENAAKVEKALLETDRN